MSLAKSSAIVLIESLSSGDCGTDGMDGPVGVSGLFANCGNLIPGEVPVVGEGGRVSGGGFGREVSRFCIAEGLTSWSRISPTVRGF